MKLWQNIVKFLYPRRCPHCGTFLGGEDSWCKACLEKNIQVRRLPLSGSEMKWLCFCYALGFYRGTLGEQIRILKYKKKMYPAKALVDFVQHAVRLIEFPAIDLAFYVPLHSARYKERGFNQVEEIFRPLVLEKGWPLGQVCRAGKTVPQYGLTAAQRSANLRDAFILQADVKDKDCLLLDDIATSGATLLELARLLKKQGARSVYAMVAASDKQ